MIKRKSPIIIMLVSAFLAVGLIVLVISVDGMYKQSEETTTLYTATVKKVDITDTGKQLFADIYVEEYSTYLSLSINITQNIETSLVEDLETGESIFFRIANNKAEMMNEVQFIDIVSLETETKTIFSLSEYNAYMHSAIKPAKIAGTVMAVLFLCTSVFCFFKIKKTKKKTEDGC